MAAHTAVASERVRQSSGWCSACAAGLIGSNQWASERDGVATESILVSFPRRSGVPPSLAGMTVNHLTDEDFLALYGRWAPLTPSDVKHFFASYPGLWWIAGGWAIEAFTGASREHDDIDPSVLRNDLPLLRRHLAGRLHAWAAAAGSLTPLLPDVDADGAPDDVLPRGCGQIWARPDAASAWEYDILLSPGSEQEWVYKRDSRLRLPMTRALWERDGVRYLRPELQLLLKSRGLRDKDERDFTVTAPLLERSTREWLRDALTLTEPNHPWIARLDDLGA